MPLVMAVNREYADADTVLGAGDELALIPPVSGGAPPRRPCAPGGAEPLSPDRVLDAVRDPRAGAVVTFSGVTREVETLEYEAYVEMAEETAAIVAEVRGARPVRRGRSTGPGRCRLSEPSVIVAASAPHRGEAFAGARELIDRIKAEAPIWKKEIEGG